MISKVFIVYVWMLAHHVFFSFTTPLYFNNGTQRCYCDRNKQCKENGDCEFYGCDTDYRGRFCQQIDAMLFHVTKPQGYGMSELHDGKDYTCAGMPYNSTLSYTFDQVVLFFWVYLAFDRPYKNQIGLRLFDENLAPIDIHQHYFLLSNKHSGLLQVSGDVVYKRLKLTNLPALLCSVDISGGRNLALPSLASQSNTRKPASLANDGVDRHSMPTGPYECAIAIPNTAGEIWWKATLLNEAKINIVRFEIAPSSCRDQRLNVKTLISSGLTAYNADGQFDMQKRSQYLVLADKRPVKEIVVTVYRRANYCNESKNVLALCELEVFGEYHCPDGQYGPLCELSCPGCTRDLCDPDWGCLGGCQKHWYLYEHFCLLDCNYKYGFFCQYNCSKTCKGDGHCARKDGTCIDGCVPGFIGTWCDSYCFPGTFGERCSKYCFNCKQSSLNNISLCDNVSGKCLEGCAPGYEGKRCVKKEKEEWPWSNVVIFLGKYLIPIILVIVVFLVIVAVSCAWILCKTPQRDVRMDLGKHPPLAGNYQPPNYQHHEPQLSWSPNEHRLSSTSV